MEALRNTGNREMPGKVSEGSLACTLVKASSRAGYLEKTGKGSFTCMPEKTGTSRTKLGKTGIRASKPGKTGMSLKPKKTKTAGLGTRSGLA